MNLVSLLMLTGMLASSGTPLVFAAAEATDVKNIYETTVIEDLNAMDIDTKTSRENFEWLGVQEYHYDPSSSTYFNLVFYFYASPVQFRLSDIGHYVNLGYSDSLEDDAEAYNKYRCYIENSKSGYYKAVLYSDEAKSFYDLITDHTNRTYNIAGFTTRCSENGKLVEKDHDVSAKYSFTGYMNGVNGDTNTLECHRDELTTISVDLNMGVWLTDDSYGWRTAVYYTWFGLSHDYVDLYGDLYAIHYDYNRVLLKPMFHFYDGYTAWTKYSGTKPHDTYWTTPGVDASHDYYDAYLCNNSQGIAFGGSSNPAQIDTAVLEQMGYEYDVPVYREYPKTMNIATVITSGTANDEVLPGDIIEKYQSYETGMKYSEEYVNVNATNIPLNISIPSNSNINSGFQNWFMDQFGGMKRSTLEYEDLDTWSIIPDRAATLSNNLFASTYKVRDDQATQIKNDVSNNINSGKDTYLFRYETENYYSENIYNCWGRFGAGASGQAYTGQFTSNWWDNEHVGAMALMYYTDDFDIIDFTFHRNGEFTVIPVVADPKDNAPGVVNPTDNENASDNLLKIVQLILTMVLTFGILALVIWLLLKFIGAADK